MTEIIVSSTFAAAYLTNYDSFYCDSDAGDGDTCRERYIVGRCHILIIETNNDEK